MVAIKRLATVDADFTAKMDALLAFEAAADDSIEHTVAGYSRRRQGARRCGGR